MAKFLGTTDEVTTCDCCGRTELKSTVAIEMQDGDEPVYYGVVCAARALKVTAKEVKAGTKRADDERKAAENRAKNRAWQAEKARWEAFCAARGTGADLFRQIESMGGYAAARALYKADAA